jgi:hypothetical protein
MFPAIYRWASLALDTNLENTNCNFENRERQNFLLRAKLLPTADRSVA